MEYQDPSQESSGLPGDPRKQAQQLQDYLDGKTTGYDLKQGMPVGYKIDNGKVVESNAWDQWGKGATEFFGPAIASTFIPGLGNVAGPGAEAGGKMGILDTIGKVSNAFGPLADVLGNASKSGQQQNNTDDYLKTALYGQAANAKLNAKKFATSAPGARMSTAMRAALTRNATPASTSFDSHGIPVYSGGVKSVFAAAKDPQYQQLSDQVLKDELMAQMQGGASGGNQDVNTGDVPEVGQRSAFDNILGGSAFGSSILAALSKSGLLNKKPNAGLPPTEMG